MNINTFYSISKPDPVGLFGEVGFIVPGKSLSHQSSTEDRIGEIYTAFCKEM